MELRVFDKTVQPLGAIDELASLLWHTKYFDVGTFSLLAPITDNSVVCGIVTGTVEEIDASVLTKQFTDFFNTYSAAVLDEFSAYKQSMEKYLTEIAGVYDSYVSKTEGLFAQYESQFNERYSSFESTLDNWDKELLSAYTEFMAKIKLFQSDAENEFNTWFDGNMPDGVGIPVGNLTSQLFANIYLDALDQFIKHELGVEAYIRYMDDFVILSPDKEQLRSWLARIEQFLREELKLEFNPKTTILAAKNGIDFVGYKHRATHRKVRKDSIKRIKRTIKKCESGKITKEQLQKSIQSWTGHAGHADSYNLRKKIETLAEAAIEKAA